MTKFVYPFGDGFAEGDASMKDVLGGKGANLAEMCKIGLPVPPGLTISTDACHHYYRNRQLLPQSLMDEVYRHLSWVEEKTGCKFGDEKTPLLVSVRSGAPVSMPGMMDTILNLGLNDKTVHGLIEQSGDKRFAMDSYRRFIQMFSDVVLGVDHGLFEEALEEHKAKHNYFEDTEMNEDDWAEIVEHYKEIVVHETSSEFPEDPHKQLQLAIQSVFNSWMNHRACVYRELHHISADIGTAVNIQAMVFGNMGDDCATGVAFTRDPSTGENIFYGEYLCNAQGEDVVAGIRTPLTLSDKDDAESMVNVMPYVFKDLSNMRDILENHYKDMQDIEFTVQKGKLWLLQTRSGKRTSKAAIKIAVDMVEEGLISKDTALLRVDPSQLNQLLHPSLDDKAEKQLLTRALPASPGAASGHVVFSSQKAEEWSAGGKDVILVRIETSPDDIHGMHAAKGILTSRGGMTSHAAVVARGMGRSCVAGASSMRIDYKKKQLAIDQFTVNEGDIITLDGASGSVYLGSVPMKQPELSDEFKHFMAWADEKRHLKIRMNAETPLDTKMGLHFGAEGIGLCRTEHMFFDPSRIISVRKMILADNSTKRQEALDDILPMQTADFEALFELLKGQPLNIRLLDPPLHEFLPHTKTEIQEIADDLQCDVAVIEEHMNRLKEVNPMLGHRGCRLGITYPEIYRMQARAIFMAARNKTEADPEHHIHVEIMIPLTITKAEMDIMRTILCDIAKDILGENAQDNERIHYQIGTMIELPRAALMADEIARSSDFFSFGTNDLTQSTLGLSRDDSASFLGEYVSQKIFEKDPFVSIDQSGVGSLIRIAKEKGRHVSPSLKLGICGEHGGDPESIDFCHRVGLDYVSCSPYRVPIARLSAAQAAIRHQ